MVVVAVAVEGVEEEVGLAVAATLHGDVALPHTPQFDAVSPVHDQGPGHAPTTELLLLPIAVPPR
jgi:hypothetical protein